MDKKAKDILFNTYWSSKGWKEKYSTSIDNFKYAKEKGLMFEPRTIGHDECVNEIIKIVDAISLEAVIKAFLSSLSTRRLDWRSGIASYYIAKLIIPHKYMPIVSGYGFINGEPVIASYTCEICKNLKYGVIGSEKYINEDLNIMNFERIKWGGVRHGNLIYTLFDLEQFKKEKITEPTEIDIKIFKSILDAIKSCNSGDSPSKLRDKFKDIPDFRSNNSERSVIIEILACIGILNPKSYNRPEPAKHDWTYATFWRGEDGYDKEIVEKYFGKYLKSEKTKKYLPNEGI